MNNPQTNEAVDLSNLPRPEVELVGADGNVFGVVSIVVRALRDAGWTRTQIEAFKKESMQGDYDHVIRTCMKYTEVC